MSELQRDRSRSSKALVAAGLERQSCRPQDEAADIAANGLFIEMTKTAEADATFRRFSTAQSRETS